MARNINGGTDHIYYTIAGGAVSLFTIAFRMKTTQTTANTVPLSYWSATSRNGFGIILNNVANKLVYQGYETSLVRVGIAGATSVNTGSPFNIVVTGNRNTAGTNTLYVNGTSDGSANSSSAWNTASVDFFIQLGDQLDAFWSSYVGDIWDIGYWNAHLTTDEIASYDKGFPASKIRPSAQVAIIPLVRDAHDLKGNVKNAETGTTTVEHGRVVGGSV